MKKTIVVFCIFLTLIGCEEKFEFEPEYFDFGLQYGGEDYDYGRSISVTKDGGYIICGATDTDVYLIKTDNNGNELWSKTFGGESWDNGRSISTTEDGGYIICGVAHSFGAGQNDAYLIKTDNNGNELWSKTFGGESDDWGSSISITEDGGYIICGDTESFGTGQNDVYLIKTDNNGNELWSKTFGGESGNRGVSISTTEDGGYIIYGNTEGLGVGPKDIYLIKTDNNGNELWSKIFGGKLSDWAGSISVTGNGEYIMCGTSSPCVDLVSSCNSDIFLIKTDSNGKLLFTP